MPCKLLELKCSLPIKSNVDLNTKPLLTQLMFS